MLVNKLTRLLNLINRIDIAYFKEYGFLFAIKYYFYYATKQYKNKNNMIEDYLTKMYEYKINQYNKIKYDAGSTLISQNDFKIWVFWWQGEKNMPPIVKICFNNLKKRSKQINVCLITKDNFDKYIKLPEFVMKKFYKGNISITHFSDIIRFYLLYNYGGLWIDSTVWISNNIESFPACINSKFFTCKLTQEGNNTSKFIAKERWTSFIMGTNMCKNPLFKYGLDMFLYFLHNHTILIDYFLLDHILNLLYKKNNLVKKLMDDVPINNINIFELEKLINKTYDKNDYAKIVQDTNFHKLSWKNCINFNKKDSYYAFFKHSIENKYE